MGNTGRRRLVHGIVELWNVGMMGNTGRHPLRHPVRVRCLAFPGRVRSGMAQYSTIPVFHHSIIPLIPLFHSGQMELWKTP